MAVTIHSLVYKISSSADLKGMVATRAELATSKKLYAETRTATEQFTGSIAALNALHKKGAIDAETHRRAIDKLGKEMKEAGASSKLLAGAGGLLGQLGIGVSVAGGVAIVKDTIRAGEEAVEAEQRLEAALRATGNTTGMTRDQIIDYSDSLQRLTGIDDELFTNAQAELATFGNIHGKVFTDAIKLSADLSRVYGTDLKQEVEGLGRALSNPLEAIDRLRIGKEKLTSAEKDSIKAMAEAGDVLGAQQKILDIVAGKVGGAAEAMRSPLQALKGDVENLQEAFGGLFAMGTAGGKWLDEMGKGIQAIAEVAEGKGFGGLKPWESEKEGFWAKHSKNDPLVNWLTGGGPAKETVKGRTSMATPQPEAAAVAEIAKEEDDSKEVSRLRRLRDTVDLGELNRKDEGTTEDALGKLAGKGDAAEAAEMNRRRRLRNTVDIGELNRKDDDTAADALGKIEKAKGKEPPRDAGAASLRGSAAAYSTIVKAMSQGSAEPAKKTEKNTERTARAVEQGLEEQRRQNAKPPVPIQIINF